MKKRLISFGFVSALLVLPLFSHAVTSSINQLVFTTAGQSINTNTASAVITIQTQNASSTVEQLDTSSNPLIITSSSATGQFSSSASGPWSSAGSFTMADGTANKNFYYKDSVAGTYTITATLANGSNSSQTWTATQTVTVAPRTIYVTDLAQSGADGSQAHPYYIIQDAVSAANSGDVINIASGAYNLTSQLVIDKDLTIEGAGIGQTTFTASLDGSSLIKVNAGKKLILKNLSIDGTGLTSSSGASHTPSAVEIHGSSDVENLAFSNIKSSTSYEGDAVLFYGEGQDDQLIVRNSTFTNIGRNGIYLGRSNLTSTKTHEISGNTYTGKGIGNWMDYFLVVNYGAIANITNNTVSDNLGVASSDGSDSSGIAIWDDPRTQASLSGNTFNNNSSDVAIAVINGGSSDPVVSFGSGNTFNGIIGVSVQSLYSSIGTPMVTVSGSKFLNSSKGFSVDPGMGLGNITISHNWWGSTVESEIVGKVATGLNPSPFCATPTCTSDYATITSTSSPLADVDFSIPSGSTADSTNSLTLLEELNVALGTDSVSIPNGTEITKSDNSTFAVSDIVSSVVAPNTIGGLASGVVADGALQWGIPGTHLSFSNPITITIHVDQNLNGTILKIYNSVDGIIWEDTGKTCSINLGVCTFETTSASYFVASHVASTPSTAARGGSASGRGRAAAVVALTPAASTPAGRVLGAETVSLQVQAQIDALKIQIASLIQQLLTLLRAQLAAAGASQ